MVKKQLEKLEPLDVAKYGVITLLAVRRIRADNPEHPRVEHLSHTDIMGKLRPQEVFPYDIRVESGQNRVTNPFFSGRREVDLALTQLEEKKLIHKEEEHAGQHRLYTITDKGMKFYHERVVGSHHLLRPEKDPLVPLHEVKAVLGRVLGKGDARAQQILDALQGESHGRGHA